MHALLQKSFENACVNHSSLTFRRAHVSTQIFLSGNSLVVISPALRVFLTNFILHRALETIDMLPPTIFLLSSSEQQFAAMQLIFLSTNNKRLARQRESPQPNAKHWLGFKV